MRKLLILAVGLLALATVACDGAYQIKVQNGTSFPIDVLISIQDNGDSEAAFKVGDDTNWGYCQPCELSPGETGLGFVGDIPRVVVMIVARDTESKKVIYTRIESISQLLKEKMANSDASTEPEFAVEIVDQRQ